MKSKIRAAAIICYKDTIILIKREKGYGENKKIYYVIPGGTVENNEDIKSAAIREIYEEVGIKIKFRDEYFHLRNNEKDEYFFIADYVCGNIGSGTGPEFTNSDYDKYGSYEIFLAKSDIIHKLNLMPPEVKQYIIENIDKILIH